jgi:hypothetical protein
MAKKSKNKYVDSLKYLESFYSVADDKEAMGTSLKVEDHFYGIIDETGNVVYPSETNLKEFKSAPEILALGFVADAYEDFQKDINRALDNGTIRQRSFLRKIKPVKGWESALISYDEHMNNVYRDFVGKYLATQARHTKIVDFSTFVSYFLRYVRTRKQSCSMTKHIVSFKSTRRISGLIVEVLDNDYNDKKFAAEKVLNDPYFNTYHRTARKYGFKIDATVPWRLYADIKTAEMRHYMNKPSTEGGFQSYGIENITSLFNIYYYKTYRKDILFLKKYLIAFYNNFAAANPFSVKTCQGKNKVHTSIVNRATEEEADLDQFYSDASWALLYLQLRLIEESITVTPNRMSKIRSDILRLERYHSFEQVAKYIRDKISKFKIDQVA